METTPSPALGVTELRLAARIDEHCEVCIESLWKRCAGLALRFSAGPSGVVERPGRTRFDLRLECDQLLLDGPLRARGRCLPVLDESLGLVVLDRLDRLGSEALGELLGESVRTLAQDGHLLVMGTNPWGLIGLRARWRGQGVATGALRVARLLRQAGLEDVSIEHRLWWPPLPAAALLRWSDRLDAFGRNLWPALGSLYVVSARKRGSSVISIPLGRSAQRQGVMAAAGSMRRAS